MEDRWFGLGDRGRYASNSMANKHFFMTGDDWGLSSIVPAENAAHCQRVIDEADSHHKNTEFSLLGSYTVPFLIPEPQVSISDRSIKLAEAESILADLMPRAGSVGSCVDTMGKEFACPDCFAFMLDNEGSCEKDSIYGRQTDQKIESLHATDFDVPQTLLDAVVEKLVVFGTHYDLILFVNGAEIVDLRVPDQVWRHLHYEDEDEA